MSSTHIVYLLQGMKIIGNHVESSWDSWGDMRWPLLGCLALSWTIIFLCMINGIQSYGKIAYFITLFPYVVLTILLAYVSTLDGFMDGVHYYTTPDWEKLAQLEIWNAAASQVFYSLGVAVGCQLILASYNDFKTNCHRDAMLIGLFNSSTSIFAGFVVFGTVGFVAKKRGVDIEDVITAGAGLTFVVYPEAVAAMNSCPQVFSFLFFFMLVLLATSSVCGSWEVLVGSIYDQLPSLSKRPRWQVMLATCFVGFLAGIPMCFDTGFLLFQMMDHRTGNSILLMAFVELVYLSWCYGTDRFFEHIKEMGMYVPLPLKWFWSISWNFTTPLIVFIGMS